MNSIAYVKRKKRFLLILAILLMLNMWVWIEVFSEDKVDTQRIDSTIEMASL